MYMTVNMMKTQMSFRVLNFIAVHLALVRENHNIQRKNSLTQPEVPVLPKVSVLEELYLTVKMLKT